MEVLGSRLTRPSKMGFHIPPFSSVHHLHLHVLVAPYNLRGKLKYPLRERNKATHTSSMEGNETLRTGGKSLVATAGKGISWFVGIDQAVGILQGGGKIGLGRT
jgi:hypothetical protein